MGAERRPATAIQGAATPPAAVRTRPPPRTGAGDHLRWVGEGLGRVGGASGGQRGDEDDETVDDCRAASALLLRPWIRGDDAAGAIAALAEWIPAHVRHHLTRGRGRPVSWQWRLTVIAWVMEQCGIHVLVGTNRQAALAHIEALGLLAAAGRALPFVGWAAGRATAAPGVNIPGMRHRNPLIFDTAWGHRGGDAERLLERVVKRIGDQLCEHRADGGATGDQGGLGPDDVDMQCEDTAANRGGGGDVGHAAAAGGGDDGSRDRADGAGPGSLPKRPRGRGRWSRVRGWRWGLRSTGAALQRHPHRRCTERRAEGRSAAGA